MLSLVLFDMDGVVFEGKNFWLDLHRALGTEAEAWALWDTLSTRDYGLLSRQTARLWQGRPANTFARMIADRPLVPGITDVFGYLNGIGVRTAIISTGPYQLAERAQRLFDIAVIRANRLAIDEDGCFAGTVEVQVDENDKASVARDLMARFGAVTATTAMIGDSAGDAAMADLAGLSIAYGSDNPLLRASSTHVLEAGALADAVPLLQAHYTGPSPASPFRPSASEVSARPRNPVATK